VTVVEDQGDELVPVASAPPPVTLFRSEQPDEIITTVAETANALSTVIDKQRLSVSIQGRKHVLVEGWTLLGTMLGVFPVCVWTRKLENGWEARVEARTRDGSVVGAAEAECLRSERSWASRDDYALRSMAQTRATSKALRQPLGFVMTMAGFSATPAEEMVNEPPPVEAKAVRKPRTKKVQDDVPPAEDLATPAQTRNIFRLIDKLDKAELIPRDTLLEAIGKEYGTESPAQLTKAEANDLITRLKVKAGEET